MADVSGGTGGDAASGGGLNTDAVTGALGGLGIAEVRPSPTLRNAVLTAGGVIAAFGLVGIGNDNRGASIALSLLAMAIGFAMLFVPAVKALAPAGLAMIVTGLVTFALESTNDGTEPGVGAALTLIGLVSLILFVVPITKGKPIFLGAGLVALWAAVMSTYVDFFGRSSFSLSTSDLTTGEKGAYLSMVIGAAYVGLVWVMDNANLKAIGATVAAAAVLAYGVGAYGTLFSDNIGRGIVAVLVGLAFCYIGNVGSRRATTWAGAAGIAAGLFAIVDSFFDGALGTGAGFVLLLFGLITIAAAAAPQMMADGSFYQMRARAPTAASAGDAAIAAADASAPDVTGGAAAAQPADWYPDPSGTFELRWYDGNQWTEHVSKGGERHVDPPPS